MRFTQSILIVLLIFSFFSLSNAKKLENSISAPKRSSSQIMKVVSMHLPGLQKVYDSFIKLGIDKNIQIKAHLTISPEGKVIDVHSNSAPKDLFWGVIKDTILQWNFPPMSSNTPLATVVLPLRFAP